MTGQIYNKNKEYWKERVPGYSEVNKLELTTGQREKWKRCLHDEIAKAFPCHTEEGLRVLDIGTGPGFFAIILCELGYDVTAIDLTPAMLAEAKRNAGALADQIKFAEMDAESLAFPDCSFDVVISRNLTWNLPHPGKAYAEWARVLKRGGLLLNFDANWYAYLFDEAALAAYRQDRVNSAKQGVWDQNVGDNFDVMDDIARQMPLSNIHRPDWDKQQLSGLGLWRDADETVWQRVWSDEEKLNFASTPMFMVRARK